MDFVPTPYPFCVQQLTKKSSHSKLPSPAHWVVPSPRNKKLVAAQETTWFEAERTTTREDHSNLVAISINLRTFLILGNINISFEEEKLRFLYLSGLFMPKSSHPLKVSTLATSVNSCLPIWRFTKVFRVTLLHFLFMCSFP